ncbi:GntP family permease [Treponema vincentii]|uniref:GntP family permease n=1 Tax=Treponema vincentii TaxID=69710 RepID=UPI0020A32A36|nr:hypothetical protein [Treponema vincentii]UTC46077.1 GntP family permease [Treponema vincentii]
MNAINILGIVGIIAAFILLTILIMKGLNIFLTVFICTLVVAVTTRMPIYGAFKTNFMVGFSSFFQNYFLLFLTGTLLAKAMDITGAAKSIAKAIIKLMGVDLAFVSVPLACGVLAYGGVTAHVCAFCVFSIALQVFRAADIPRRIIPGALCFGCSTFAMISPGAVQIHNAVPANNLGTPYTAGFVNGWISCLFMLVMGLIWLSMYIKKAKANGEHFAPIAGDDISDDPNERLPAPLLALLPLIVTIILVNIKNGKGAALIPVEVAVLAGTVFAVVVMYPFVKKGSLGKTFTDGVQMCLVSVTATSAVVGFGYVVSHSAQFSLITNAMINVPGPKLLSLFIGTTVIAGVCGSASGGLGIAVPILGPVYTKLGLSAASVHRVMALSSSALDSLPHNGYIVTVTNGLCRETHKASYGLTFRLTVVVPFFGSLLGVLLFTLFPNLP